MSGQGYLEPYRKYMENFESLRLGLQRNITLMNDLKGRGDSALAQMERSVDQFVESKGDASPDVKMDQVAKIENLGNKAKECGNDVAEIATQNYNMVDTNMRLLDTYLAQLDTAIKTGSGPPLPRPATKRRRTRGNLRKKSKGATGIKNGTAQVGSGSDGDDEAEEEEEEKLDGDPDEETYCYCKEGSFGKMICCDNNACPIGWYHMECLQLFSAPLGKWFCSSKCGEEGGSLLNWD